MYAIIVTGGKQYKVTAGDMVRVEKLEANVGDVVTFDNVLAINDGTLKVASDVEGTKVSAKVVEHGRGTKVIVYKYKAKKGYHKKRGHRQSYTKVLIEGIEA